MAPTHELWLLDDSGKRILLLQNIAFFSYSRTIRGFGTCLVGLLYKDFAEKIFPVFQVDRRIDIFRSSGPGFPMRREGTYLLRLHKIYTRQTDNMQIISFYGRDLKDLLRRRYIIQPAGYSQTRKTDFIDDMMKEIVREQMLYGSVVDETGVADNTRAFPKGEFSVQGDVSLGTSITSTFADRNVLDILKELQDTSFQLYDDNPSANSRIYFDIIAQNLGTPSDIFILDEEDPTLKILDEADEALLDESSPGFPEGQGLKFVTFADLRGQDRTGNALVFSVENNNIEGPYYTLNHNDEANSIIVKGFGRGDSRAVEIVEDTQRIGASRWNRIEEIVDASTEPDQDFLEEFGFPVLHENRPKEELSAVFLDVPESVDSPRSLYGVDWDLGDLLPVDFANRQFDVEVSIVYVAVDETGLETITGRNNIFEGDQ